MINKNMPNSQPVCCALRDHHQNDPHWQLANPSQPASEILFKHWVLTHRNTLPSLSPKERLTCPLLWCGVSFDDNESLLQHLKDCPQLPACGYWCPGCHRAESFATTKKTEAIPRSDNQSPEKKKQSRLRKLFCKYFSCKRAKNPRKDPTTKPEPVLQEIRSNRDSGITNCGHHNEPTFCPSELETRMITFEMRDDSTLVRPFAELPGLLQQPDSLMQGVVAGSSANGSSYPPTSSQFLERVSGRSGRSSYSDEYFSEPENSLHYPADLDRAPSSLPSGYGSAAAPSLVQNHMKLTMDPQLSSTTMNFSSQDSPLSASSDQTNTTRSGDSTVTALNPVATFSDSCSPSLVQNYMKLTMDPQLSSTTMNFSSQDSPQSASSDQTNTTWSDESTVTALNPVANFSDSCSPYMVSPQHKFKSSAKPSRKLTKAQFQCSSCGEFFTDRANLGRHGKLHRKGNSIPCRAGCGTLISGGRTDNERRHYQTHLERELKEVDPKPGNRCHLDYEISKRQRTFVGAVCGMSINQKDVKSGHDTTRVQKEQEGDTTHELIHRNSKILHSDEVHCSAGSSFCFNQDDDDVGHQNTPVEKELVMDDQEPEKSYTEPRETGLATDFSEKFDFSEWLQPS